MSSQAVEGFGIAGVKLHRLACARMPERQMRGMKSHALDWIGTAAIGFVAGDGMAAFGEVDADLVFAPGFQPHFDERGSSISFYDVDVGYGKFSTAGFSGGINTIGGILGQMRPDREVVRRHTALDDGDVFTAGGVVLELSLQVLLGLDRFREHQ